jgi:hypothetical protein
MDPDLPVRLVLDRPLLLPEARTAVSTSLAFGGSNAALVFSRWLSDSTAGGPQAMRPATGPAA